MIYTDSTTLEDNSIELSDIENEEICDLKVSNRLLSVIDEYLLVFVENNKVRIANKSKINYVFPVEIHNFNESEVKINFINKYIAQRSEEHTSELQSRFDLVCRLLLEK